jgi:hypothetical protein
MTTATQISRTLHTLFARSERQSTRIAGVSRNTTGYSVMTDAKGWIWVTHHGKNALSQVNAYDVYLMSKGFHTVRRTDESLTVHQTAQD